MTLVYSLAEEVYRERIHDNRIDDDRYEVILDSGEVRASDH